MQASDDSGSVVRQTDTISVRCDCEPTDDGAGAAGRGPGVPGPRAPRIRADLPRALDERMEVLRGWQAACYEAGYVGRAWPSEFGGGGRPPVEQIVVDQELAAAGAPEFVNVVGLDVLGPVAAALRQRRAAAPLHPADPVGRGDLVPGLLGARGRARTSPSLRTRAVEHDDHFVLSGQKTWVSWGQYARWCGVLARTDESRRQAPRHLDADRRHALAGRRGAPDDADHRPRRVLRAVPRRRRRAQGEPARRARRRLEDRHAHARPRARHRRAAAAGEAAHVARPRGARRRAARARRAPILADPEAQVALARALDRDRGAPPPRLPDRGGVPQRRRRRPGQLEREAADGRGRAAARRHGARGARPDAAAR